VAPVARRPEEPAEPDPSEAPAAAPELSEATAGVGASGAADAAAVENAAAPTLTDQVRRSPGRHRRLRGLLGHRPRSAEDR
jgi:hypothetical protein